MTFYSSFSFFSQESSNKSEMVNAPEGLNKVIFEDGEAFLVNT